MRRPGREIDNIERRPKASVLFGMVHAIVRQRSAQRCARQALPRTAVQDVRFPEISQVARQRKNIAIQHARAFGIGDRQGKARALQQSAEIPHIRERQDMRRCSALRCRFTRRQAFTQLLQCLTAKQRRKEKAVRLQRAANLHERARQVIEPVKRQGAHDKIEFLRAGARQCLALVKMRLRPMLGIFPQRFASRPELERLLKLSRDGAKPMIEPIDGFAQQKGFHATPSCPALRARCGNTIKYPRRRLLFAHKTRFRFLVMSSLARRWSGLARQALDLLYPPLCFSCRAPVSETGTLCAACWNRITFLDGPCCEICGLPFDLDPGASVLCAACHTDPPSFDKARAIMRYDDHSRAPILALKHADKTDLAPGFGPWLERAGLSLLAESDVITAVPLHRIRLWRRRYNQASELARALAARCGKPHDPLLLQRLRHTKSQGVMPSASARTRNVQGAFALRPGRDIQGRTILVIDDVFTTGATANACARTLKRGGAARVFILSLARVVRG